MTSLLNLPNELLLLISTEVKSEKDLSHLLQVNHHLYDILLPVLYQQNVESLKGRGLVKCAANGNERGVRHFLYWGAYVDVRFQSTYPKRETNRGLPLRALPRRLPPGPLHMPRILSLRFPSKFESQTALNMAASGGHDAIVKLLLNHGAQINASVKEPSHHPAVGALFAGHESTLRLLLEWGALTEGPNLLFRGLINCAVASGQMPMLKLLIEFGVDVNAEIHGNRPLTWAVGTKPNYASMVEVLLDNGANIALVDDHRGILLQEAIISGTIETVDLLLKRGANYHTNVFHKAIGDCTLETTRLLLDHGARVDIEALLCAVRSKKCETLELLIGHGVDLNLRDSKGCTVLHHAIRCCWISPSGLPGMTGFQGCSRSWPLRVPPFAPSPLHVAAYCWQRGNGGATEEDIVRCLIRRGADVNAMDAKRQTPLYFAWKYASPAVQDLLLENGADWTAMLTIY